MQWNVTTDGLVLEGAGGRVRVGPCRPALLVDTGAGPVWWRPETVRVDDGRLVAGPGPSGVVVEVDVAPLADYFAERVDLFCRVRNTGSSPVHVHRLVLLTTDALTVGADSRRWRTYRNGFQSWAGTMTIGTDERDADIKVGFAQISTNDAAHPAPTSPGHVRSDTVGAVSDPVTGDTLAVSHLNAASAYAFVELVAPAGAVEAFSVWVDLDGTELPPGEVSEDQRFAVVTSTGPGGGWHALDGAVAATGAEMSARGRDGHHPGGWCSWYYHFTKVTASDVDASLAVLAADGRDGPEFGCEYVMVDDGHQEAIGDWLDTNAKFPDGMAAVAGQIHDEGFDAGIWWAPFLVDPASDTARAHPEWLVRNAKGKPIMGLLNPMWSSTRPMRVLDTTNPAVLAHIEGVAATIRDWGYQIQKLDFLYAASLPGVRHDMSVTRARSLRMGLDAVRAGAGDESFLLGCGCPQGPAVGVVDAMRIGADVSPYWSNPIDRVGGRGRHGVSTRNAVVNTLTRSVLDGRWWLNDPDCLMVRDNRTRMDLEEVRTLATVIGLTDGMAVLSDRMDKLPAERRRMVAQVRDLSGGRPEVLDLFEQARPELVVSRRDDGLDVGVLNMGERPRRTVVDLRRPGLLGQLPASLADDGELVEFWTGAVVPVRGGLADFGEVPPHGARVVRLRP